MKGDELLRAIRDGDGARVATLVVGGASLGPVGEGQVTPLYLAAREGHADIVRLLLRLGAPVDEAIIHDEEEGPRRSFATPLKIAITRRHEDVVVALLDGGADVEHHSAGSPDTPLGLAVRASTPGIVERLVERGARVTTPTGVMSESLAMVARARGDVDVIAALERAGAPAGSAGTHALVLAIERGDDEGVREALEGDVDVDAATDNHVVPLAVAATRGRLSAARALVERGATVTVGMLEAAALLGHRDVFDFLLEQPISSIGSKARDRDAFAIIREKAKKHGWERIDERTRPHRERLGLVKAKP